MNKGHRAWVSGPSAVTRVTMFLGILLEHLDAILWLSVQTGAVTAAWVPHPPNPHHYRPSSSWQSEEGLSAALACAVVLTESQWDGKMSSSYQTSTLDFITLPKTWPAPVEWVIVAMAGRRVLGWSGGVLHLLVEGTLVLRKPRCTETHLINPNTLLLLRWKLACLHVL